MYYINIGDTVKNHENLLTFASHCILMDMGDGLFVRYYRLNKQAAVFFKLRYSDKEMSLYSRRRLPRGKIQLRKRIKVYE